MSANVVNLQKTIEDMVDALRKDWPGAKRGVLVLFDEHDNMHTAWMNVNDQQLALASCRLSLLAAGDR